jgi:hypothetical protein
MPNTVILKSVPETVLNGLPDEDQAAIRAAIGKPMTIVGRDHGRTELEFTDAAGDLHTIWIDTKDIA